MRHVSLAASALSVLLASSTGLAAQESRSAVAIADRLRERMLMLHPRALPQTQGARVEVGGGAVQVAASIKAVLRQGEDWIVDAEFVTRIGGTQGRLEHVFVGIGPSRADADVSVADDWMSSVGFPLLNAVIGREEPLVRTPAFDVFAGLPGSHATVSPEWMDGSDPLHAQILASLLPVLDSIAAAPWTSVALLYLRTPGGVGRVDCSISGQRSDACELALSAVSWPRRPDRYMLKQAYVLRSRRNGDAP